MNYETKAKNNDSDIYLKYNLQFFADEGPGGEKTEEPTSKKLEDARKEGQVAKSKEIASSLTLLSLFILLKIWTGTLASQLLGVFELTYNRFEDLTKLYDGKIARESFDKLFNTILIRIIVIILPFLLAGFVVAFLSDLIQVKWKPTSKLLQPKLNKLSPIAGVKRIFNIQSLVELLKSLLKLAMIGLIVYNEIKNSADLIFMVYDVPLTEAVIMAGDLLISLGLKISAVFVVIAAADFIFQKWKFHKDMKMTKQEVKEEYKSSEGDPEIKGKIKAKMQEASRRRMMKELPKADVVITNPTHYAVAILYDKETYDAPIVVAKGADYLAQKIKEEARSYDISIVENKPLARSLYANVEIGEMVPPELYVAVAEVLAAVYKATGRV